MNQIFSRLIDVLWPPPPPPNGGFIFHLPEAFGAVIDGEVQVIGYKGEWFIKQKLSLWIRLHNWLISTINRRQWMDAQCPRRSTND